MSGPTGAGAKYFDDLKVQSEAAVLLSEGFDSYGVDGRPDGWRDTTARGKFEEDPDLFKTLEVQDNLARWATIEDYPLLLRPLGHNALEFDGEREYVGWDGDAFTLGEFTLEVWVRPVLHPDALGYPRRNPILTLRNSDGLVIVDLRINTQGHPRLEIEGQGGPLTAMDLGIERDQFTHLAVSVGRGKVTFYVCPNRNDAVASQELATQEALSITLGCIEVGWGGDDRNFRGRIAEVRLWSSARSGEQIAANRYQVPDLEALDLVSYWPFVEFTENGGVKTVDASVLGDGYPLRLGGPEQARRPTLAPADWNPTAQEEFWDPDRLVLECNGVDDALSVDDFAGIDLGVQRRTVEVWFAVGDRYVSNRAQVIYKEGNAERGLVLYVHQGYLYFGGYNQPKDESNWSGTWLRTDRIVSGRWHHAALVLDGRPEVREGSLQGFLDGKVMDVGPGSQLWPQPEEWELTLGNGGDGICCHDDEFSGVEGQYFQGRMLELRVWNTARTPAEIADSMYESLTGSEDFLELLWRFDQSAGTQILDKSDHGHDTATSRSDQLQAIGALPAYLIPPIPLDEGTLCGIATVKKLKDESRWSMEQTIRPVAKRQAHRQGRPEGAV